MANYQIITDSGCDLPVKMLEALDLKLVPLNLLFRDQVLEDSVTDEICDVYAALRAGEAASTSAVNPERWAQEMEPVLQQGKDILVLGFSSGLSTTYQSAVIAANDLLEKYPERKINVVDTLCASLGQGLLVWYACKKRDEGLSLEELTAWVEENKFHLCHWFTVDDLMYLKRGGRVSAATALVGTMLKIKPVLHVDNEGHLINVSKVRGRKASIEALAEKMAATALPGVNDTAFICHGDCIDDANYLAQLVKERCGVKEVFIGYTGAVIGSHSGPGTLALFFLGEKR
ncbi:MAG: DegV family protein [Oscillospiraceae bacterium]|nr:DegV family protein [Oscillospiraceae bacterium]